MPETNNRLTVRRVLMSRQVAEAWVRKVAKAEYRFQVLGGAHELRRALAALRAHRDGKLRMAGVDPIGDLGIQEGYEGISFWSGDRVALLGLKDWFEKRGHETTGVW